MPIIIFLIAFILRLYIAYPSNTVIGFDQSRDLWDVIKIVKYQDLRIIGPIAGNSQFLHHGVLYYYLLSPLLYLFNFNPFGALLTTIIINSISSIIMYYFMYSLVPNKKFAILAGLLVAVSYKYINFSLWLSNPTISLPFVLMYYYFLFLYINNKLWGLPLSFFMAGLAIQSELFFIYLIPVSIMAILLFAKTKIPSIKITLLSLLAILISLSTMILTEFKNNFMGIKSIIYAGRYVGGEKNKSFLQNVISYINDWKDFGHNILNEEIINPKIFGIFVLICILLLITIKKDKVLRKNALYIIFCFFSPSIMLLLGYHNSPWFLIGRSFSVILQVMFLLAQFKPKLIGISISLLFIVLNFNRSLEIRKTGPVLLEPDKSSKLSDQIDVVKYTYNSSFGKNFTINTLTNPLYINSVWSYHYYWYSNNYNLIAPSFMGSNQEFPYNYLETYDSKAEYLYLIIDLSPRIPIYFKDEIINSSDKISFLLEEKKFGDILVQKRHLNISKLNITLFRL